MAHNFGPREGMHLILRCKNAVKGIVQASTPKCKRKSSRYANRMSLHERCRGNISPGNPNSNVATNCQ